MRLLVTGGMGFIGVNFVRRALADLPDLELLCNLDALTYAAHPHSLDDALDDPRYLFRPGDICDAAAIAACFRECRPTHVVHMAAESNVDISIAHPAIFLQTNVFGTFTLLEHSRLHEVEKFLYVSTDEVYGEAAGAPSTIDDTLNPKSPYAASKAGGELLALAYHHTFGLPLVRSRCGNNYGGYQDPSKLIPRFIINALAGQPLPVYGTGRNTRDWVYVGDHCAYLLALLLSPYREGQVFNISARQERSVLEIAQLILAETGAPADLIVHVPDRLGHVRRHALAPTPLMLADGALWQAQYDFPAGLRETVRWYRHNSAWWQAFLDARTDDPGIGHDRRQRRR